MSRRKARHLAPVPKAEPTEPAPRRHLERLELPTGGNPNVHGLLRELAAVAFPKALASFTFESDRTGPRCFVTVAVTGDEATQGSQKVARALLALGVVKAAKPAEPAPQAPAADPEKPPEDGAPSPAQQSQPS